MQTDIADFIRGTEEGRRADAILRTCVHCGFCNATCPTYLLLGDELDGPRGRIYLMKQVLEGVRPSAKTQLHLDRCLTCRACETTCPSGVRYASLLDIGRELVERLVPRPWHERLIRRILRAVIPYPRRFGPLLRSSQWFRPMLPAKLKRAVPPRREPSAWPTRVHPRKMLVLDGCVQPAIDPNINAAAARVLDRLGISFIRARGAGCCGAVSYHLSAIEEARRLARRNIRAWWPHIEAGTEAIVMTASGCGVFVRDYGQLLRNDPAYAAKAEHVAQLTRDISEVVAQEDLSALKATVQPRKIAFHAPCTLQHGLRLDRLTENLLTQLGFDLSPVSDPHLCCGSAGTYSLLQRDLSAQLLNQKVTALEFGKPEVIATANIGCLAHLQSGTQTPVRHWIELLDAPF